MVATKSDLAREASSARASAARSSSSRVRMRSAMARSVPSSAAISSLPPTASAGRDRLAARVGLGVRLDPLEPAGQRAADDQRQQQRDRQPGQRDRAQQQVGEAPEPGQRVAARLWRARSSASRAAVWARKSSITRLPPAPAIGRPRGRRPAGPRGRDVAVEDRQLAPRQRRPCAPTRPVRSGSAAGRARAARRAGPPAPAGPRRRARLKRGSPVSTKPRAPVSASSRLSSTPSEAASRAVELARLGLDGLGAHAQARDDGDQRQDQRQRDDDQRQQADAQGHADAFDAPAGNLRAGRTGGRRSGAERRRPMLALATLPPEDYVRDVLPQLAGAVGRPAQLRASTWRSSAPAPPRRGAGAASAPSACGSTASLVASCKRYERSAALRRAELPRGRDRRGVHPGRAARARLRHRPAGRVPGRRAGRRHRPGLPVQRHPPGLLRAAGLRRAALAHDQPARRRAAGRAGRGGAARRGRRGRGAAGASTRSTRAGRSRFARTPLDWEWQRAARGVARARRPAGPAGGAARAHAWRPTCWAGG